MDIDEIMMTAEERMENALDALHNAFGAVRTGRASGKVLDRIKVDYYGAMTPINQLAGVKAPDAAEIEIGVRPEGFVPKADGALTCGKQAVEVMGRDITIVAKHDACENAIRAIVSAEMAAMATGETVRFDLKPNKVFAFDTETGARIAL